MPHGGRHLFWLDTLLNNNISSGGNVSFSLMQDIDSTESRIGMTLMRIILCMQVAHAIHDSGEGTQMTTAGIGIVASQAFTAGEIPQPNVMTEFPLRGWIWRCRYLTQGFAADQAAVDVRDVNLDLRAKRKLDNGTIFMTAFNEPQAGVAGTVRITGLIRCLWMSS